MMNDDVYDEWYADNYDIYAEDIVEQAERLYQEWLEEPEMDEYQTKAERREAQRAKGRYGPIRHIDPNLRPKKIEKPRIHVRDKFKRGK